MSYPWWMFTVWFSDGWDGVYQAAGMTTTDALLSLLQGFMSDDWDGNDELKADEEAHGGIVKIQYEKRLSDDADAAHWALTAAQSMQTDINHILTKEDVRKLTRIDRNSPNGVSFPCGE